MTVEDCDIPATSLLDRDRIAAAYYRDAYSGPLSLPGQSMVEIFFALFGHHPMWVKRVLVVRNRIAVLFGLDVPPVSEIMNVEVKDSYAVGDRIGPWPIFLLTADELIAGRDNRHLDFRLSVLRHCEHGRWRVVVSTICLVHNLSGKLYLFFIVPFHRWGVRRLISDAVKAGRL